MLDRVLTMPLHEIYKNTVLLTRLFPMHPFFTPWKHQKTVQFSDVFRGRKRVHLEKMG